MKLEEIQQEWSKDSQIDPMNIDNEALNISKLHNKYYAMFSNERLIHKKLETDFKKLYKLKYEHFQGVLDHETYKQLGWEPCHRNILKSDIPIHIDADDDIINLRLKIELYKEKLLFLESIIDSIGKRTYAINSFIDWQRFVNGNR